MSTKKVDASGLCKSKVKSKTDETLPPGPSSSKFKTKALSSKPKTLDLFAKPNSKKDMFSLAPSKPKMLDMFAVAPSKPKTFDLLTVSKTKSVPFDSTSLISNFKSKSETPKPTKMLGSHGKAVVNQPGLKPKSTLPPPPPHDRKTLMELHYSRYLRAVVMNNIAQLEEHYTKKVNQIQESMAATKKAQLNKEQSALKATNSNILDKKRDIEEAEILINQYKPVLNLSAVVDEKLNKLTILLEDKTNTLPVANCELSQPVDHGSFKDTISGVNTALQGQKLGAMVVRTSNNKESIAEELEKIELEGNWIHKLNTHTAVLASMEATVNKEYAVEFEDQEDEERLSSFTGSVVYGKVEISFDSAELSSIAHENEGPILERGYEEPLPLDEDFDVDVLSLLKRK